MDAETATDTVGPLSHNSRQCQLLLESMCDCAIYTLDTGGHVRSWNTVAERIHGYAVPEVMETHFSRFFVPEDAQRGEPAHLLEVAKRDGRAAAEGWRLHKDGSQFLARVVIEPVLEVDVLVGFAVATCDISERHAAQQSQQVLAQAQRSQALGRLTRGMAHDFNNLLTVMATSLDLISRRAGEDARLRTLLGAAQTAVERGTLLTRHVLAFARGQQSPPQRHAVNAIVTGALELLQRACPAGLGLSLELAQTLPDVRVDPGQLDAALLNLVFNSCDAMPDGGTIVLVTAVQRRAAPSEPHAAQCRYISVAVRDNGSGMPADVAQRAGDAFFTTKDAGKNAGLGLSQVFGFASQSGGFVELETAPGHGTTVTLFLPAIEDAEND
ncbi:two-component system sensor histidine kinase NtrB [Xanthomonas hortorum]|uniref:two-component system sensor histidine kinase NtrB n=1 Tax=Xanthomonas hortorum TaxID=56454 RepID=UPI001594463C|nr:ATP-binding protein [Xanthomonas hortorum]NHF66664.1 PAS domain S-box protein [Xanthomonas hortorum]